MPKVDCEKHADTKELQRGASHRMPLGFKRKMLRKPGVHGINHIKKNVLTKTILNTNSMLNDAKISNLPSTWSQDVHSRIKLLVIHLDIKAGLFSEIENMPQPKLTTSYNLMYNIYMSHSPEIKSNAYKKQTSWRQINLPCRRTLRKSPTPCWNTNRSQQTEKNQ